LYIEFVMYLSVGLMEMTMSFSTQLDWPKKDLISNHRKAARLITWVQSQQGFSFDNATFISNLFKFSNFALFPLILLCQLLFQRFFHALSVLRQRAILTVLLTFSFLSEFPQETVQRMNSEYIEYQEVKYRYRIFVLHRILGEVGEGIKRGIWRWNIRTWKPRNLDRRCIIKTNSRYVISVISVSLIFIRIDVHWNLILFCARVRRQIQRNGFQ
jgi:hypothetical protein